MTGRCAWCHKPLDDDEAFACPVCGRAVTARAKADIQKEQQEAKKKTEDEGDGE